jgi:hypothetical protein
MSNQKLPPYVTCDGENPKCPNSHRIPVDGGAIIAGNNVKTKWNIGGREVPEDLLDIVVLCEGQSKVEKDPDGRDYFGQRVCPCAGKYHSRMHIYNLGASLTGGSYTSQEINDWLAKRLPEPGKAPASGGKYPT